MNKDLLGIFLLNFLTITLYYSRIMLFNEERALTFVKIQFTKNFIDITTQTFLVEYGKRYALYDVPYDTSHNHRSCSNRGHLHHFN